jgi:hypothetical protein
MSRFDTVGKAATKVDKDGDRIRVTYHSTTVVDVNAKTIRLNTGGYFTNTTKVRMNQASKQFSLGFRVYSMNWSWFVDYKGKTINFEGNVLELRR